MRLSRNIAVAVALSPVFLAACSAREEPLRANWYLVNKSALKSCANGQDMPCLFVSITSDSAQAITLQEARLLGARRDGTDVPLLSDGIELQHGRVLTFPVGPFDCAVPFAIELTTSDGGAPTLDLPAETTTLPPAVLEQCRPGDRPGG